MASEAVARTGVNST